MNSVTWSWHDSCGNCGCVANWHKFEIPPGASMEALPTKFPCGGFEFEGCPANCENFVFPPATMATSGPPEPVEAVLNDWRQGSQADIWANRPQLAAALADLDRAWPSHAPKEMSTNG